METDDLEFWSDEAMDDKMALNEGIIGVGIDSDTKVSCEIEQFDIQPELERVKYEHISEAVIDLKSGNLQILDCPESSVQFEQKVTPGTYRFRMLHIGLNEDDEHLCRVEYWSDTNTEKRIIKKQS